MASIEITRDELVVRIRGWSKELAMRGTLRIPMAHVRAARVRPSGAHVDDVVADGWRGWGTEITHKMAAGPVYLADGAGIGGARQHGKLARSITVDVDHENVRQLVIEIDGETPEAAVRRIVEAIDARRRRGGQPASGV